MNECDKALNAMRPADSAKADQIRQSLAHWQSGSGLWRKLVDNLCVDPHLPDSTRASLMNVFAPPHTDELELKMAFVEECHKYSCAGPVFHGMPKSRRVWRAVNQASMLERWHKGMGAAEARLLKQALCTDITLLGSFTKLRKQGVSKHPMWATWSGDAGAYPFASWHRANHVRACLGLSELDRKKHLLVLGYDLPVGHAVNTPTVADAADFPYFKPNLLGTPGLTDPWPSKLDLKDQLGNVFNPIPCPEVIHLPVVMDQIKEAKCLNP